MISILVLVLVLVLILVLVLVLILVEPLRYAFLAARTSGDRNLQQVRFQGDIASEPAEGLSLLTTTLEKDG